MKNIYSNPVRVYLLLAFLALVGIWAGFNLPVSLYPNVSQPQINLGFSLAGLTPTEFRAQYGSSLETSLKNIKRGSLKVETVEANYHSTNMNATVTFNWNADPDAALQEVKSLVDSSSSSMPQKIRDSRWTWSQASRQKGFFVATCQSSTHTPSQLYDLVQPLITSRAAILDDGTVDLWDPNRTQVVVALKPNRMASFGLYPANISDAIEQSLKEASGGNVKIGQSRYSLLIPRRTRELSDVENIQIVSPLRGLVRLTEVADVSIGKADNQIIKTSGVKSLILIGRLKDGGNIKRLSENLKQELQDIETKLPPGTKIEILVDPSVSISESVQNVVHEVMVGAGLAVVILFLFIGSFRNVITAAIEIPLSIILALILMKMFGMNLNLISLGGLALSSGMNVDASVVVMENIFQKFRGVIPSQISAAQRIEKVVEAVKEVISPILASTIASLVVFIPIIFTSDLTYAILGDLAKAVVFSHVFSAFIALLLVPTVRLHLMRGASAQNDTHKPPIERGLVALENSYADLLFRFSSKKKSVVLASIALVAALASMGAYIIPALPTEIIGKPNSDMIGVQSSNPKFTTSAQLESLLNSVEVSIRKEFPSDCAFTYTESWGSSSGVVFCKLKNKRTMTKMKGRLEEIFKNTPEIQYGVFPWSVAELPLPESSDARIALEGGTPTERASAAAILNNGLQGAFPHMNFYASSATAADDVLEMQPKYDVWRSIQTQTQSFTQTPEGVLAAIRSFFEGEYVDGFKINNRTVGIKLKSPQFSFSDIENFRAAPIPVGSKVLPLKALFEVNLTHKITSESFKNGESNLFVQGSILENFKNTAHEERKKVEAFVKSWRPSGDVSSAVTVRSMEPNPEEREAIHQLMLAATLSVALILLTMFVQFGTVTEALLVLVAVPLALLGVLASLFIFKSTLSVNSVLGVILLNGIAVANSILLVDCAKKLFHNGAAPIDAVVQAAKRRIRPILMTSLTTILGMMPIALGLGDGGKVLQPLGIAVSGGMWISMLLTLFMVPALHGWYLQRISKYKSPTEANTL